MVDPIVLGAATGGYRVRVLLRIAGEEVLLIFPSMWCLPQVEYLIYFMLLQKGD